ncbi:hypothetical protein DUI87_31987 [Hirundo rustica rustica]|uniref:Uncharacterized protein n=1 Tax=Hirundo rustica rustica TaxID=333673 RepID=A0A3M0ISA7_HIRRU|nr:hypothetical protein DUI87_31987 [Hirundo rustica rustica]
MRMHQLQIPQEWGMSQPASHGAVLCFGELSEEQKVELEHSQRQMKHREWEVNQLREKLSEMSSLVGEKDRALKAAAEELRGQEDMSNLEDEAHREAEDKALLREAPERMQLQLDQEKRLQQAAKRDKPGATKPLCSVKPRATEHVADAVTSGSS